MDMSGHPHLSVQDSFHWARSLCIDAFAQMEEAIVAVLAQSGKGCESQPFGQKLKMAQQIKASPSLSKQRLAELKSLLKECQDVAEIRNDIVHSRMQVAVMESQQKACFSNSRQCLSGIRTARLFTYEALRNLSFDMASLARKLRQAAEPNSS